jgi:hypothetical protein
MVGWSRGIGMRRRGLELCEKVEEMKSFGFLAVEPDGWYDGRSKSVGSVNE